MTELYKLDSEKRLRILRIWTEGNQIIQESGLIDGKLARSESTCVGKNTGKTNGTTADEQAVSEMESKITKKLKKEYFRTIEEAQTATVILPMLAKKFKEEKKLEMVKIVGVASAMGDSSRNLWLKIPYGEHFERVAGATTLPLLMLGGESAGDPTGTIADFEAGMKAGKNVRGALVGRNILFPGKEDPLAAALAVNQVVHNGFSKDQAIEYIMNNRDQNLDALTKYIK